MSDDDLIRRGDALRVADEVFDQCENVNGDDRGAFAAAEVGARIAALPAVTVGVKPLVWFEKPQGQDCRIGRCEHIAYAVERRGDFWGFRRSGENGLVVAVGAENAFRTEAEAMAGADRDHIKRILAALAPTDAAHVNETPKSEHDAGNVLTDAAQAPAEDAHIKGETAGQMLERLGMDGAKWAAEFRTTALRLGYSDMDEGWLIGWFCNAIMAGYDRSAAQAREAAFLGVCECGMTGPCMWDQCKHPLFREARDD